MSKDIRIRCIGPGIYGHRITVGRIYSASVFSSEKYIIESDDIGGSLLVLKDLFEIIGNKVYNPVDGDIVG